MLKSLQVCIFVLKIVKFYFKIVNICCFFQIMYNKGSNGKILPDIPQANVFIYCFSTAILFHAAILEPQNLRLSYWKFLQSVSGGCMGLMDRYCLDAFGLKSSESLEKVLMKHKPVPLQLIQF